MQLYPLRFKPLFREYIWGGRRLGTELKKQIGAGETYAESWEIVDHGDDQSIVSHGDLAGMTLGELVRTNPIDVLGKKSASEVADAIRPKNLQNRFPLLFKFLDANQNLSVQVHPDDTMGATLPEPDLGKTEAWIVMGSSNGAKVYAGLKSGVGESEFRAAIDENRTEDVLHSFEPKVGDCIFIPAGTVHALGKGLLIAEIQQCSNTTFRLYDWGRVDTNGKGRQLHIESGIAATDFSHGPISVETAKQLDQNAEQVVTCDKFTVKRMRLRSNATLATDGGFRIIVVISGSLKLSGDPNPNPMTTGCCALIPASIAQVTAEINSDTEVLIISN